MDGTGERIIFFAWAQKYTTGGWNWGTHRMFLLRTRKTCFWQHPKTLNKTTRDIQNLKLIAELRYLVHIYYGWMELGNVYKNFVRGQRIFFVWQRPKTLNKTTTDIQNWTQLGLRCSHGASRPPEQAQKDAMGPNGTWPLLVKIELSRIFFQQKVRSMTQCLSLKI